VLVLKPTHGTLHVVVSNLKHSNCGGHVLISKPSQGGVVVVSGAEHDRTGMLTLKLVLGVGFGGGELVGLEGGVVTVKVVVTVAQPVWQVEVQPVTVEVVEGTTQGTDQVVFSMIAQAITGGQVMGSWPSQAVWVVTVGTAHPVVGTLQVGGGGAVVGGGGSGVQEWVGV